MAEMVVAMEAGAACIGGATMLDMNIATVDVSAGKGFTPGSTDIEKAENLSHTLWYCADEDVARDDASSDDAPVTRGARLGCMG